MAKSKRCRTVRGTTDNGAVRNLKFNCDIDTNIELSQEAIDRHWDVLPPQSKRFIMDSPDGMFPLDKLIKFWSSPQHVESTQGSLAGTICGAAWYLALVYMKLQKVKEARALTINGSFIHQCYNSSIEYIKDLSKPNTDIPHHKLPYFVRGLRSIQTPGMMESFIQSYLPKEYTHMMTSFANMSSRKHVMGYIDQISNDWNGPSSALKNGHHRTSPAKDGIQIKLVLVDDTNEDERYSLDIGSSTSLKALFNDYADKRDISLRSLRFSYEGKSLFLSSAGHKTPEELGMRDQDVIMVHDTSKLKQSSDDDSTSKQSLTSKNTKANKRSKNKNKKTKRKSKKPYQREEPVKTLEEYNVEHSKRLTKIHGEAQDRFKRIRQRLNNLVIERSQPKIKPSRSRTTKSKPSYPHLAFKPSSEGIGGKAGKSRYEVQVGEVQHLYKTTKPSVMASHCSLSSTLPTLDLHGCTREEALGKLDESLKAWVDSALQGSYPFVRPATIVCGCGNQIMSDTVQEWIRSNNNVSNAPKIGPARRRGYASRAA